MPLHRRHQIVLIVSLLALSWLGMMLVHELGHVLAALATGGTVQRVVWHPLVFSRTDVSPNPAPRLVVWAGPIVGVLLPLALAGLVMILRLSIAYLFTFFAGFCFLANGAYIGIGAIERIGDAEDMLRLGTPSWVMGLFGLFAATAGLWVWHRVSPKLGFGKQPDAIAPAHAYGVLVVAVFVYALGFVVGDKGV